MSMTSRNSRGSIRSATDRLSPISFMVNTSRAHSQSSLRKSARKAVRISKTFVGKVTSTVLQKPSNEHLDDITQGSFHKSSTSSATSTSTALTYHSLPEPDYGDHFLASVLEAVNEIVIHDCDAAQASKSDNNGEAKHHGGVYHNTEQSQCFAAGSNIQQSSRADSALDLGSTFPSGNTSLKAHDLTTSKLMKVRHWGKRLKKSIVKLSPSKSVFKAAATLKAFAKVAFMNELSVASDKDEDEGNDEDDEDIEDTEDDEDEDHPRCEFKVIEAISDEKLQDLVRVHCQRMDAEEEFTVVHRTRGAWNFAAMVNLTCNGTVLRDYVVRIPGHDTPDHWTPQDAYMLEREVQLIDHIRSSTTAPVPEIIAFDKTHDNILGHPYILMVKLPGKSAFSVWFDQPYDLTEEAHAYRMADVPSTLTEKKRINLLRSLARHMASIQCLSFDNIGMVEVSDVDTVPTVGPHYRWKNDGSDAAIERRTACNTLTYAYRALTSKFSQNNHAYMDIAPDMNYGNFVILHMVINQAVFSPSRSETFTIHHDDLDLQNILVDDEGNVTGIIDWQASYAAPRCIGSAAVPIFLRGDWFPYYANNFRYAPHMAWNYERYREIYAAAMFEAGNPDAHLTLNSALYQSVFAALTEGGDRYDLVAKILQEILNLRVNTQDFQLQLGQGWPAASDMLKEELPKIFACKLPRAGLLAQLDSDMILKEWWLTFDTYLEEDEEDE